MIVKYRMNSTCTLANMKADINKIILGTATSPGDFSSGCDTANTTFYGTYPSSIYAVVNAGSSTYSKKHNDYGASYTHYFRLTYDSTKLQTIALASGYTSGTDTLINSQLLTDEREGCFWNGTVQSTPYNGSYYSQNVGGSQISINSIYRGAPYVGQRVENQSTTQATEINAPPGLRLKTQITGSTGSTGSYVGNKAVEVWRGSGIEFFSFNEYSNINVQTYTFNANTAPFGIDIIITDKCLIMNAQGQNTCIGIIDIGKNGITRNYTDSMMMASVDLNCKLAKIPYTFKYSTNSYGASVDNILYQFTPVRSLDASNNLVVIENPVFLQEPDNLNAIQSVYGIFAIPQNFYTQAAVYTDGTTYRYVYNGYAIPTT
jgi:hypothetical protein